MTSTTEPGSLPLGTHHTQVFLSALFALALSAGGCGGDSPAPAAPMPTTPAATPTPPAPVPPGVPSGLHVSASAETFIEWTWNAVEGADGYEVQISWHGTFAEGVVDQSSSEETTYTYRQVLLDPGTVRYLRVRAFSDVGVNRLESAWSEPVMGRMGPSAAAEFLLTCPTRDTIEDIDRDLELSFIADPTRNHPLVCTEAEGSVDLTMVEWMAYQSLRLMKATRFSEPLLWTESLYDWLVNTIDGIEYNGREPNSFCCRNGKIVISTQITEHGAPGPIFWHLYRGNLYTSNELGAHFVSHIALLVHETRHAEGPAHTCGTSDQTFEEMGAWAYHVIVHRWYADHFQHPADFFSPAEIKRIANYVETFCDELFCVGSCPAWIRG